MLSAQGLGTGARSCSPKARRTKCRGFRRLLDSRKQGVSSPTYRCSWRVRRSAIGTSMRNSRQMGSPNELDVIAKASARTRSILDPTRGRRIFKVQAVVEARPGQSWSERRLKFWAVSRGTEGSNLSLDVVCRLAVPFIAPSGPGDFHERRARPRALAHALQ